jgi:threonine/homoserine/homoserine lactone efflux protein
MTYLAVLSARRGRASGYVAVLGVALGLATMGAAAALGLAALIGASPALFAILRWGGAAYILYLAWGAWREADTPHEPIPQSRYFVQGLVTNLLNPKAALFYVTVMPNFLAAGEESTGAWVLLASVYVGIATAIHLAIVTASGMLEPLLTRGIGRVVVSRVFALILFGVAGWILWSTRPA